MDKISAKARSENMRRIKSKNSDPEMAVRSLVHRMGYRFRLHRKDLPGKPDLVFPRLRKVIFVHGCFWHRHENPACLDGRMPKSRPEYWIPKLTGNQDRDKRNLKAIAAAGWQALVLWECDIAKDQKALEKTLRRFLRSKRAS